VGETSIDQKQAEQEGLHERLSENIETRSNPTRKAEHRGSEDERHWEDEGMKAMVNMHGTEHRRRREDTKGKREATKEKHEATSAW